MQLKERRVFPYTVLPNMVVIDVLFQLENPAGSHWAGFAESGEVGSVGMCV